MIRKVFWVVVVAGSISTWLWWGPFEHWISYSTGSYNTPGSPHNYNYNSGFGSIVESVGLTWLGIGIAVWWNNQCHVAGCYWPGLSHRTQAGDRACWRHHPESKLSAEKLRLRHHEAAIVEAKLDEIHRHVTAISPEAGKFTPDQQPPEEEK